MSCYVDITLFAKSEFATLSDDGRTLFFRCIMSEPNRMGLVPGPAALLRMRMTWPVDRFEAALSECVQKRMLERCEGSIVVRDWLKWIQHTKNEERGILKQINQIPPGKFKDTLLDVFNKGASPEVVAEGLPVEAKPEVDGPKIPPPSAEEFLATWNGSGMPKCIMLSDNRRRFFSARCRDKFWCRHWREALEKMRKSDFCTGKNDWEWAADVEFFLRPETVLKIMEGQYGCGKNGQSKPPSTANWVRFSAFDQPENFDQGIMNWIQEIIYQARTSLEHCRAWFRAVRHAQNSTTALQALRDWYAILKPETLQHPLQPQSFLMWAKEYWKKNNRYTGRY